EHRGAHAHELPAILSLGIAASLLAFPADPVVLGFNPGWTRHSAHGSLITRAPARVPENGLSVRLGGGRRHRAIQKLEEATGARQEIDPDADRDQRRDSSPHDVSA